ncbi:acetate kinase [[Clostridium] methylpentosum DSM 5476]|uniref:Acetate kinase n=1 Tax=[Clostridium] methylpentosum DSM 5476 TaxID=537013 RepID=C0E8C0_9FIRM|nr:acetate kinase [[Clostridium] methylpentosum DSM 5476]MDY3988386.1 acetate kinase [Massilioclostridium sp.]MEE1490534.1 acetate kinase [Massilioclostridium sp.]
MNILVINSGSSSLKYQFFDMDNNKVLAKGNCERIGIDGVITHKKDGKEDYKKEADLKGHDEAIQLVLDLLMDKEYGVISSLDEIDAVGHRIAHGGEKLRQSSIIGDEELKYLESIQMIAPLHVPPAIKGIVACKKLMDVPQVGVFDTSFYSTMEDYAYIYPLPYDLYEKHQIRRYGFHGTSHRYVASRAAKMLGKDMKDLKIVTCHLGNGSSITAVNQGKAVDTSMGFMPNDGILMGTRCGAVDPSVLMYLINSLGMDPKEVEDIINKKSGLLGVTGVSSDARDVREAAENGDARARLAEKILVHGIKKFIGSYAAEMNGLDVVVFTAGLGENSAILREWVCTDMDFLGIQMDNDKNANSPRGQEIDVSAADSKVKVLVIPTNEEYMIALDTAELAAQDK